MNSKLRNEIISFGNDEQEQSHLLSRLTRALRIDDAQAKDAIGDALVELILIDSKMPDKDIGNFNSYIFATARNKVFDNLKKARKEENPQAAFHQESKNDTETNTLEFEAELNERRIFQNNCDYILENVEQFIPDDLDRRVFLDFHIRGKSYKEIRKELLMEGFDDIKLGTLRTNNCRTLSKIKDRIQQNYPDIKTIEILKTKEHE